MPQQRKFGQSNTVKDWKDVRLPRIEKNIDSTRKHVGKKAYKQVNQRLHRKAVAAKDGVILTIGGHEVMIRTAKSSATTCVNCFFSNNNGRSCQDCPSVVFNTRSFHLCTILGNGKNEYFIDISEAINESA